MFDRIRLHFNDGNTALIWVNQDDSIQDTIVDECSQQGWNTLDIEYFSIEDKDIDPDEGF